ncbi:DUF3604 domain-containing protein [Candidatus Bathyarchaeota archaeon]|nr:DUF3604 domain-containing protein [Candidatus Bathyarchaeota archaeon]
MADEEEVKRIYGYATIEPSGDVVAGSYGTWTLTYVVGSEGVSQGGCLRITTDSDTDWGRPQFNDPKGEDYMKVYTDGKATLATMFDGLKTLYVWVKKGRLKEGDKIFVVYGDGSFGSPGSRAQTFMEEPRYFKVSVDPLGSGRYMDLPDTPHLRVIGGSPERLVVIAPSIVEVSEQVKVTVKAEDKWGNPSHAYRGRIIFSSTDSNASLPSDYTFKDEDEGVHEFLDIKFFSEGLHEIEIKDLENGLIARSNPILVRKKTDGYRLFWGDLHGQVDLAVKAYDYFRYARDISAIDFAGFQRNDHNITNEDWKIQQKIERLFNQPGRFITFPGYEWSADTKDGGHRNVYFPIDGQPIRRSSHWNIEDKSDVHTDLPSITKLYEAYRDRDVIIIPHVGGRKADLSFHEPKLEPVIEVSSSHGTFEWFLEEAVKRGYKVGFIAGSDGYMGRPGGSYPGFHDRRYAKGGLTGIFAKELTRGALWEALKNRRCYGTTGARIILLFESEGHFMGEEYTTDKPPKFKVFVAGTEAIEKVELMRGLELAYSHPISRKPSPNKVRILWEGASRKDSYSGVIWEGKIRVKAGRILSVQKIRFDSPRSKVYGLTDRQVNWYSVTCGYPSGLILELDDPESTVLDMTVACKLITGPLFGETGSRAPLRMSYAPAEQIETSIKVSDLDDGPITIDIGTLNRKITVSKAPSNRGIRSVEFEFLDKDVKPGLNIYYLRVTQTDMEKAWSSPIFVNYRVKEEAL